MVWSLNVLYWCFLQCSVVMARVVLFFCLQDVHCVVKHSTMFTVASTAKKTIWWSAVPLIIHWFNRQCWEYQWIHDTFLVQYQYHWYILGCISIINHWYMTVIHLLKANHSLFWNWRLLLTLLFYVWCKLYVRLVVLLCMYFCVFLTIFVFSFKFGACWGFQKCQQSIENHDALKMYQYHDTV